MLNDREEAGVLLAGRLTGLKLRNPIILAIPRGGVVLGCKIAKSLNAELDIITPRKLKDQYDPELALGAVMYDGTTFLNEQVISVRNVDSKYLENEKSEEMKESLRRLNTYKGKKEYPRFEGRDVVIVDDGIATGATMIVATEWMRKQNPGRIIIAVPVVPAEMLDSMEGLADRIVYLDAPEFFFGIGQFYKYFPQVEDSEVIDILKTCNSK